MREGGGRGRDFSPDQARAQARNQRSRGGIASTCTPVDQVFTALFQGGSNAAEHVLHAVPLRLVGRELTGVRGLELRIQDARGVVIGASGGEADVMDLSGLPAGAYWVRPADPRAEAFPVFLAK